MLAEGAHGARPAGGRAGLVGERALVDVAFARLDPRALAIAMGGVAGLGLWLATAILLLRGGVWVGMHLGRLAYYLPGYRVSWAGAFVGLVEAAALGAALGLAMAWLWNLYHRAFLALVRAREVRRELSEL